MMIDDERLAGRIENALAIIECAFQDAIDNEDCSDLLSEMQRGYGELRAIADEIDSHDPTPWCHICGAREKSQCHCGPIAEND